MLFNVNSGVSLLDNCFQWSGNWLVLGIICHYWPENHWAVVAWLKKIQQQQQSTWCMTDLKQCQQQQQQTDMDQGRQGLFQHGARGPQLRTIMGRADPETQVSHMRRRTRRTGRKARRRFKAKQEKQDMTKSEPKNVSMHGSAHLTFFDVDLKIWNFKNHNIH